METTQWFILRGEMKFGPYEYKVLLQMLQNGELFDYNYAWAPHLEKWTLIGELPEFSKEQLLKIIHGESQLKTAFKQREFPRIAYSVEVLAHNNHRLFDGHSLSLSASGALLLLNDPLLLPGHRVFLHFQGQHPFNAVAEVVRKNISKVRLNVKSGLHYAVRFLQVQPQGVKQIQNWIETAQKSQEETNDGIY
ncbi:MAG: DUF4339 domain-containing protein [Bdellovibrionia bacterium]